MRLVATLEFLYLAPFATASSLSSPHLYPTSSAKMSGRLDCLSQPAPENYVAGLGRGATGFTTRSDLGPAREGPTEDQIKAAVAKRSAQLGLTESKDKDGDDDDGRYQDPDNEVGLFAGGIYEKDDEEADRIWKDVDDKMAKRRQQQRLV